MMQEQYWNLMPDLFAKYLKTDGNVIIRRREVAIVLQPNGKDQWDDADHGKYFRNDIHIEYNTVSTGIWDDW